MLERLTAPNSRLERVAYDVYRLAGSPTPDHLQRRAAWLQLAPDVPTWQRTPAQGVMSHRSVAALYGIGHLLADRHEFTLTQREQSRRRDVRLHQCPLADGQWIQLRGLRAARPARIASDLLYDDEALGAVAQIIVDAIRPIFDYSGAFAVSRPIATVAREFGLQEQTLGRWVKNVKDRQAGGERAITESEYAELLRLRKDNADLRLDRAFLKKASVFFAQEASDTNKKRSN